MNTAIAQHLNIAESAITRVEEWASVLFVVVRGLGARFVSKKVTVVKTLKTKKTTSASGMVSWSVGQKFRKDDCVWQVTSAVNTRIFWNDDVEDEQAEWDIEAVLVGAA